MELKRIKVSEFFNLKEGQDEYIFAIKFAEEFYKEEDTMGIGDVYELKFGLIKDIQADLEDGDININKYIGYINSIKPELKIGDMYLDEFTRGCNYLITSITELLQNEIDTLVTLPSTEEEQAGLDRFNGLGIYLQMRSLANNDITKIEYIKGMTYLKCYLELYTRKQENDFQKELERIYKNKSN